jgi:hypothetical protein
VRKDKSDEEADQAIRRPAVTTNVRKNRFSAFLDSMNLSLNDVILVADSRSLMKKFVCLKGRTGNQMFQYAYALSIGADGIQLFYDSYLEGFRLGSIPFVNNDIAGKYHWSSEDPHAYPHFPETTVPEAYFFSYFQAEKFFENVQDKLLDEFEFISRIDLNEFENEASTSIHVRLGDFKALDHFYHQVGHDYYAKCIDNILQKRPDTTFYIFSDEIDLAHTRINLSSIQYKLITEQDHFKTMQMSIACRNHIITNSSYAWWCAKLSDLQCKARGIEPGMTLLPKEWFKHTYKSDKFCCKNWIRVDNVGTTSCQ